MSRKIVLVTGASRGLGFATANKLAGPDVHILALARTVGGLEELDDRIRQKGGEATLVPLDITDEAGLQGLGQAIHKRWGHLDLWIHTAAHAVPLSPAGHIAEKDMDRAWAVNARGTQRLIAMLDPLLKAGENATAAIVTHAPGQGKFWGAYGASKAAQCAFATSWAAECARTGPKVLMWEPAPMATALRARFFPGEDPEPLAKPQTEADRLITLLS